MIGLTCICFWTFRTLAKNTGEALGMIYLDVDNFKDINTPVWSSYRRWIREIIGGDILLQEQSPLITRIIVGSQ